MARLLHVSDWHVGASLYRCDRAPDHAAALAETVDLAREHQPDVIVHTGDVFDALMPGHRAMRVAVDALQQLGEVAPVLVIAGNHDHPRLFEVFARIGGAASRVTWIPRVRPPARGGIVDIGLGSGERVRIAPVPFIHHNRFVDWFGDDTRIHASYADHVRLVNGALGEGLLEGYDPSADILVYAAHLHVAGAVLGGSERRVHVTEEYASGADALPPVSYAALGHIHRPQDLGGTVTAAYAGSPLPLDFAEREEAKSIVLVECEPGRPAQIERLPLTGGRALRLLTGTPDAVETAAADVGNAIVKVVVSSEDPVDGLVDRLRALMPDATIVDIVEDVANRRLTAAHDAPDADREQTLDELFDDYLAQHATRTSSAPVVQALWHAVQAGLLDEDRAVHVDGLHEVLACELPTPGEVAV